MQNNGNNGSNFSTYLVAEFKKNKYSVSKKQFGAHYAPLFFNNANNALTVFRMHF